MRQIAIGINQNHDKFLQGYRKGDTINRVADGRYFGPFHCTLPDMPDSDVLATVYRLLNGAPHNNATERGITEAYYSQGFPSLSVGDLVMVDGQVYACESLGWSQPFSVTERATKPYPCQCGADMPVDGEWATGHCLFNGYQPAQGELVKNHHFRCAACGNEQWS